MSKKVKVLTGTLGLVAAAALVYAGTVDFGPGITNQPESQSVAEGESVTFSVTAGNSMNITVPLSSSVSLDMTGVLLALLIWAARRVSWAKVRMRASIR